jgi:hypothetical protein
MIGLQVVAAAREVDVAIVSPPGHACPDAVTGA